MALFAVVYAYPAGSEAPRDTHRPAHRAFLSELADRGLILVSGPLSNPAGEGGLLIFRAGSAEEALAHTEQDPFRLQGLVENVTVHEWKAAVGPLAESFGA
ncbi:YciI family protein [Streptomyces sp. NPDC004959]|uniref:YciI family protein n=1 Tax=unclassified Streptomyces TaxID=2593676 RepID=UPI0004C9AE10|nr:YciI family protein [Streptomyces sp. NRRL F-5630]